MTEAADAGPDLDRRDVGWAVGIAAVAVALAWPVLGWSLLGWDAWPAIAGAVAGDSTELLSRPFMGGWHPKAEFYRPLTALSLALDHGLWGLRESGYQATALGLHALTTATLYLVGRRLFDSRVAGAVAAVLFAVHPLHFEILPYPARRGEQLSLLFGLLAWIVGFKRKPTLWTGALLAAAVAAKETGLVFTVALVPHWLGDRSAWRNVALRAVAPVGGFLVLRALALAGSGGYEDVVAVRASVASLVESFVAYLANGGSSFGSGWIVLLVVVAATNALAIHLRRRAAWHGGAVAATALLTTVAVHALLAPMWSSWYALHGTAAFALLVGAAVGPVCDAPRGLRAAAWICATALGVVWTVATVQPADRAAIEFASDWSRVYRERLGGALEESTPGQVIDLRPSACIYDPAAPNGTRTTLSPTRRVVLLFAPYAVEAWAHVAHPDVPVHVRHPTDPRPPGLAPQTRIVLFRQPWEERVPLRGPDGRLQPPRLTR